MTNTADPVSLISFESQTRLRVAHEPAIWAHSECIGRLPHTSFPPDSARGEDYGGTHIPVPQQFLNCLD